MDFASLIIVTVAFLMGGGLTAAYFSFRLKKKPMSPSLDLASNAIQYRQSQKWIRISVRRWAGWLHGFSTELFRAVVTTALFGLVLTVVQQNENLTERKRTLILQMGSLNNELAIDAVRQLDALDWLSDGSAHGAHLIYANLSGANLRDANLSSAKLREANLSGANLINVNLSGANLINANLSSANSMAANLSGVNLSDANLSGANLYGVSLSDAKLWEANLSGAYLIKGNLSGGDLLAANLSGARLDDANLSSAYLGGANLTGAYIGGANLSGAYLRLAWFDETTTLPDGTKWTPDTDLTRFTDPLHPNFWRSDDELSPAYRVKNAPPVGE